VQTTNKNLQIAIENLYTVFARYPLRLDIDGCPHCVSAADNNCIHVAPLRKLSVDNLARFTFKTMSTWGTVDDFRHFLPRIFEHLAADGGGGWIDPEVAFGKLQYGQWQSWSLVEQEAINNYCQSLWKACLADANHPFEIDRLIGCVGRAVDQLEPYLAQWQPHRSRSEAMRFAKLVQHLASRVTKSKQRVRAIMHWWDDRPDQCKQLEDWLWSPARLTELESAFYNFASDDAVAGALSDAFNNLYSLRSAVGVSD
jgi:hypothetical protein